MEMRIELLAEKKLIGKRLKMSLSGDKTVELWRSFMPLRHEIPHRIGTDFYSMQLHSHTHFSNFNPETEFEKWAAVEVAEFATIPDGMESFVLSGGLYAVFLHKGPASTGARTFQYIFGTWLPDSDYTLDKRPHFEILGDKYKHDQPDSEEEIWIPVDPGKAVPQQ